MGFFTRSAVAAGLCVACSTLAAAQAREPRQTQAATREESTASRLASGWTALANGRTDAAVAAADAVLRAQPWNHQALGLKIEAQSTRRPLAALDTYEAWLGKSTGEDLYLLEPVARGTLEEIAAGSDPGLKVLALERLAAAGIASARTRLRDLRASSAEAVDLALVRLGDPAAIERFADPAADPRLSPVNRARALAAAGPAAVPALMRMLESSSPIARASAAQALGKLNTGAAVPQIRALLNEPDPFVRTAALTALARLGDPEADAQVRQMLQSPVPDVRLMAAEVYADGPTMEWVEAIRPLLADPAGLTRLRAAELIGRVDPAAATTVLNAAGADENPAVRAEAMRALQSIQTDLRVQPDLSNLRRLLRDPDAATRLNAAGTILASAARQ